MILEVHKQRLYSKYGLPESLVSSLEASGEITSLSPQDIHSHLGREDIDSSGLLIKYPGNGASTIRLDTPLNGDKPQRYVRRAGEPNSLYIPSGLDLAQAQEIWLTEGEFKSLCGFAQGLPIIALSGVYNWRTEGEEAQLLAKGEKLGDSEALLPELAQISWAGKKICLLYDSDITPGHRAYDAFPRLAEQLYRLGAAEVKVISLPSVAQEGKTGLDEFILARGPAQALQDLQAMKDRKEPYLPIRAGALTYAERLIKSEKLEDRLAATTAYLGGKGKAFALEWLKGKGIKGESKTALLQEAKEKLAQLQVKPKAPQGQAGGELGPEYARVKALLQPHVEEYGLDELGRIGKLDWKESFDGTYVPVLNHICNFAAWPIREILKDSGNGTPERFLELEGLLQGGAHLRAAKIPLPDFLEKNSWAGQLWGAKAGIKPNREKNLRYIIQLMAGEIPVSTFYSHLGWRPINGNWIYLHAGGAIGPGSEAVETEISDRLRKYLLPEDIGDIKKALQASLSLQELGLRS